MFKEFKLEAVRILDTGTKTGREIEKDLEIGTGQVYRWEMLFVEDGGACVPRQRQALRRGAGRASQGQQESSRGTGHPAKSGGHRFFCEYTTRESENFSGFLIRRREVCGLRCRDSLSQMVMAPYPSGKGEACKALCIGSIPVGALTPLLRECCRTRVTNGHI